MIKILSTLQEYRLHERLGYQMTRLAKLMDDDLHAQLMECGMTRLHWCVLVGVEVENHTTPSDLAQHIGVSRPRLSRALNSMDKDGLIERNLIGGDGRTRTISLTEKGKEKLSLCWEIIQKTDKRFVSKLRQEQFETMAESVDAMLEGEKVELDFVK